MCPRVVYLVLFTDCVGPLQNDESMDGARISASDQGLQTWKQWNVDGHAIGANQPTQYSKEVRNEKNEEHKLNHAENVMAWLF